MLYPRLAIWPDQVATNGNAIYGSVAHYLGHLATVLGRYEPADPHFAQAQAVHEQLNAPFHLARTNLQWGRDASRPRATRGQRYRPNASGIGSGPNLAWRHGCRVERRATELLR